VTASSSSSSSSRCRRSSFCSRVNGAGSVDESFDDRRPPCDFDFDFDFDFDAFRRSDVDVDVDADVLRLLLWRRRRALSADEDEGDDDDDDDDEPVDDTESASDSSVAVAVDASRVSSRDASLLLDDGERALFREEELLFFALEDFFLDDDALEAFLDPVRDEVFVAGREAFDSITTASTGSLFGDR
jgi:hypothetical protein